MWLGGGVVELFEGLGDAGDVGGVDEKFVFQEGLPDIISGNNGVISHVETFKELFDGGFVQCRILGEEERGLW